MQGCSGRTVSARWWSVMKMRRLGGLSEAKFSQSSRTLAPNPERYVRDSCRSARFVMPKPLAFCQLEPRSCLVPRPVGGTGYTKRYGAVSAQSAVGLQLEKKGGLTPTANSQFVVVVTQSADE